MESLEKFRKEEFVQSYLQYRWLDETRTKYADRYFIILIAVIGLVSQFGDKLDKSLFIVVQTLFAIISVIFARTIIMFRRQQRGNGEYIKTIRNSDFGTGGSLVSISKKYEDYLKGKKVYLATWIEFIIVFLTFLAPSLFVVLPLRWGILTIKYHLIAGSIIFVIEIGLCFFLLKPFCIYNFSDEINWKKY